jgi:hypothetical protein
MALSLCIGNTKHHIYVPKVVFDRFCSFKYVMVETVSTCTKACKTMLCGIFDKKWLIQEENIYNIQQASNQCPQISTMNHIIVYIILFEDH